MNPQDNVSAPTSAPNATPASSGQVMPAPEIQNVSQLPIIKIGKFKASRMIVSQSWKVLKDEKGLAWFPVLSAIVSLVALIGMVATFFFVVMGGNIHAFDNIKETGGNVISYVILFVYYLVMFLITNYFLAGMYIIIHGRFKGQNISFTDGINGANKNLGKIFMWSLISATIGVVLRIVADNFKIVGRVVAYILGAAWSILTYFSLPALIIGQKSVKESFKDSAATIRKNWGETIIVNFGTGLFFGLLTLAVLILAIGAMILVPVIGMVILVGILCAIYLVAITIISSTLGSIFKLALYEYAETGTVPQGFDADLIRGAVKAGK
ncbi:MAG: DUF6159 family protein [bacterium]